MNFTPWQFLDAIYGERPGPRNIRKHLGLKNLPDSAVTYAVAKRIEEKIYKAFQVDLLPVKGKVLDRIMLALYVIIDPAN